MFDADRPIQKSSQDRLNRAQFAKYLARSMLDHKEPESLVIGLYGGWGVGKTSIINMAVEELNFAASNLLDHEKPIILNFSPWSYSGQHQLIYSFFRRLSSALRGVDYLEDSERIIYLLELYVSFFTRQPQPKSLRKKHTLLEKMIKQPEHEEVYGWESGRDLTLIKTELNALLRPQKHKIIIMIDNISRLYDYEIKQIFQIVKSMGDYANTVYLLAFDKEQVISALNKLDNGDGELFLEKTVQLPFDVPPILKQDLEAILADRLADMIVMLPEEAWSNEYWADMYYSSLKYFFENCRDITRYANILKFSYLRLKDLVNPMDFFAITAIQVFLPDIYSGIRDNKDLFTDLLANVYVLNKEQIEEDKSRCDEILRRTKRISPDIILALLMRLFPRLRRIYQPEMIFYHSDSKARKLKRICSPDVFDIYFRLSMQTGQVPESEFKTIIALSSDISAFDHALTRLNQDDRITQFLDQLDGHVGSIQKKNIPAIIDALLDNGDLFPPGIAGPLSLDTPMRIHRIIHHLLRRYNTPEERFLVMQHAIANANKSIAIIVRVLKEQKREHIEESETFIPIEYRDFTPEELQLLEQLTASRIQNWADSDRLISHPQLLTLLYAWKTWGDQEACKTYVDKVTKQDQGLVTFLMATLDKAISEAMTQYEKNPTWETYLIDIEAFIPTKMLEAHAKALFEDAYFEKLREREQLAIMIFLDLIKANTRKMIPKTTV